MSASGSPTSRPQVLIAGAGPVGLILAHILGRAGVPTLLIDALPVLPDEPRAVGIDPESLRTLQNLDLLPLLEDDLLHGLTGDYLNGRGELLFALEDDAPGPLGYAQIAGFNQPELVRKLAAELQRYGCVELRYENTLESFSQDAHGVRVQISDAAGRSRELDVDYLVGCDGGRSTVRRTLGIAMEGVSNPQPWLVIDTREAEYDGLRRYRFFCDPKRPGMFLQTPHNNRRWEWMLMPGDDRDAFLSDENIEAPLSPHVDVSKIDIYRRRVYDFHAIIAERFQVDRVFLAGDAAHMTPPFAGQGLNSGIRDAANLGWKLAAVLRDDFPAALLDSYEPERWQHAKDLIAVAVRLGEQIQPTDPDAAAARDAGFAQMQQSDRQMNDFVGGIFKALLDRYFTEGYAVGLGDDYLAGRMFSQPRVAAPGGKAVLLDEVLGDGFALVGYNCDPEQELGELASVWRERGTRMFALSDRGAPDAVSLEQDSHVAELFSHGDATMVLLRPDRFALAAFNRDTARDVLLRAARLMGYE